MPPRTPIALLRSFITGTKTPLAIFSADSQLVWANEACCRWFGLTEEELVGKRGAYQVEPVEDLPTRVVASLVPPAGCWEGKVQRRFVALPTAHGWRRRWVAYCPLSTEAAAVLVLIEDAFAPEPSGSPPATRATDPEALHQTLAHLRQQLAQWYSLDLLVGRTPVIARLQDQLNLAAQAVLRTVIVGSAGSGAEQLARALYMRQNPAASWPMVPLPCRLLDAELLTTTVVSHVRSQWHLTASDRVVLLLLDVDVLSDEAQWALWELLQRRSYHWHTLATAADDLVAKSQRGEFRTDLAHYLATLTIRIPSLRERRDDIPLLAQRVVEALNARTARNIEGFTGEAMDRLMAYHWPGEWDELVRLVTQAYHACPAPLIAREHLPQLLHHVEQAHAKPRMTPEPIRLDDVLADVERELLKRALRLARGNRARAARLLGISRPRLLRRIQQLKIEDST